MIPPLAAEAEPIPVPTPTPTPTPPEPEADLRLLRQQLLTELDIADDPNHSAASADVLQKALSKKLASRTQQLAALVESGAITSSDRDSKLTQYKHELERQTIELQSIEARLHFSATSTAHVSYASQQAEAAQRAAELVSAQASTQPQDTSATTLFAQTQTLLSQLRGMEDMLEESHLPPEQLQRIRHQLHAAQQLINEVQEETLQ